MIKFGHYTINDAPHVLFFCNLRSIFYENDADVGVLDGERIAVVGYGNQGRSWALNLRDSGCAPVVCVRRDETREQAVADGFEAHDVEAANEADVICILVPTTSSRSCRSRRARMRV